MTKRKISVSTEIALSFLAYNLRRVMSILGNKEILRRLKRKKETGIGIRYRFHSILNYKSR